MTTNNQYLVVVSEVGMARLKATFGTADDIRYLAVVGCTVDNIPGLRFLATEIPQIEDAALPVTDEVKSEDGTYLL